MEFCQSLTIRCNYDVCSTHTIVSKHTVEDVNLDKLTCKEAKDV